MMLIYRIVPLRIWNSNFDRRLLSACCHQPTQPKAEWMLGVTNLGTPQRGAVPGAFRRRCPTTMPASSAAASFAGGLARPRSKG